MTISDQQLDQRLARLPRACEPPETAWQDIQRQLKPRASHWPWLAMAATVAGLAVALALVLGPTGPGSIPTEVEGLVEVDHQALPDDAASWRPAIQRQPGLDAAWKENEAAILRLNQALQKEPDNLLLREFLAEARFRQSTLIELALRLDPPVTTPGERS